MMHMKQSKTPQRTQAERTRTSREKIIQSAMKTFAQKGFRGAKMAVIAEAAGLTGPGLLHHFPSKTHLLMEVLKERERIDGEWTKASLQKNSKDILEVGIELVEHNQTVPGMVQLFNLLAAESIPSDHPAHSFFKKHYQDGRGVWVQAIAEAQQAGKIRSDIPAETLGILIFAVMDGLQVQWLMEPEKVDMLSIFRVMTDLLRA